MSDIGEQVGQVYAIARPGDVVFLAADKVLTDRQRSAIQEQVRTVEERAGITIVVLEAGLRVAQVEGTDG